MGVRPQPPTDDPSEIGGYQILHTIGAGGMATVYAAMQRQPKRMVALKVIKSGIDSPAALRRFLREIEILGRLQHSYVAQIYDAGSFDDGHGAKPFFVMEHIPNAKTIIEFVAANDLDLRDRLRLFVRVCSAIDHGHKNKIIHRDIKPGNILIDRHGEPKVIDFGIARAPALADDGDAPTTELGRVVGTIQYMSPEQLSVTPVDLDQRCDVYALGALLYRLVTSRPPIETHGVPVQTAIEMIREQIPDPPRRLRPEIRPDLESIILRSLAKSRELRYPTAGALGRDIVRYLQNRPVKAHPGSAGYRFGLWTRRHRSAVITTVIAAVILLGAGAYVAFDLLVSEPEPAPIVIQPPPAPEIDPVEATGPQPIVLGMHRSAITGLTVDPSGRFVAAAASDLVVSIWSIDEQREIASASDHDDTVRWLRFDQAGDRLITVDESGAISIIEASSGRPLDESSGACDAVISMAVDPQGSRVALACRDLTIRIVDLASADVRTLRGTTGAFHSIAWSGDGAMLAAGSDRGGLYVWDAATGRVLSQRTEGRVRLVDVALDEDGAVVTAISVRGLAITWRTFGGREPESRLSVCDGQATQHAFDPTGRLVACSGPDAISLSDLQTGATTRIPAVFPETITALAIGPEGAWVAAGLSSGEVMLLPRELAEAPDDTATSDEVPTTDPGSRPALTTPAEGSG